MVEGTQRHDFQEITLAMALLAGLLTLLLKLIDYFNNNIVRYSSDLLTLIYFFVVGLLIEITIISSFLILKGYTISLGKNEVSNWSNWTNSSLRITNWLFKLLFRGLIGLSAFSLALLLVIVLNNMYKNITIPIIRYNIGYIITSIIIFYILYQVSISSGLKGKNFSYKKFFNTFIEFKHKVLLLTVLILYLTAPAYLLMGSYSINFIPQPNANSDTLTFTIKETGVSYNNIYINLYKLKSSGELLWFVDNVTINNTKEASSNKTFMLGENYDGIWYLNINNSKLQPGNYLLHAEVTDDFFKRYLGEEIFRKHADKLFYIAPRTNFSSYATSGVPFNPVLAVNQSK